MSGSDLDQFLRQPFVGPAFAMVCFLGFLLVVMIALLIYLRQRRAAKERQSAPAAPGYATSASLHEMPDLDMLVSTPAEPTPEAVPLGSLVQPPPAPARPARKGTFSIPVQDGTTTEAVEVMSILRDVVDGQLIIQMGDRAYQNINSNPEFRERFNRVMRELGQIAAQPDSAPPEAPAAPEAAEPPESAAPPPASPPPAPAAPKPRPAAPAPPIPTSGVVPGDLPSFRLEDNPMIKPKRGQKLDLKPVPEINIAGAIEAYLQYKLQHSPEYAGRSIHIYPAPDGGVSIEVDGSYYDAVGDVSDEAVRTFIAQAIEEWQERH